jgi:hypothetical protein
MSLATSSSSPCVSVISLFAAQFPGIESEALGRLTKDPSLYDTKTHQLREGLTKDRARAVLMVASHIAMDCGFKLVLTFDEQELMNKKFRK